MSSCPRSKTSSFNSFKAPFRLSSQCEPWEKKQHTVSGPCGRIQHPCHHQDAPSPNSSSHFTSTPHSISKNHRPGSDQRPRSEFQLCHFQLVFWTKHLSLRKMIYLVNYLLSSIGSGWSSVVAYTKYLEKVNCCLIDFKHSDAPSTRTWCLPLRDFLRYCRESQQRGHIFLGLMIHLRGPWSSWSGKRAGVTSEWLYSKLSWALHREILKSSLPTSLSYWLVSNFLCSLKICLLKRYSTSLTVVVV